MTAPSSGVPNPVTQADAVHRDLIRSAVVKANEPKVASRAARLLSEELLRELELTGFDPTHFVADVSVSLRKRSGRD